MMSFLFSSITCLFSLYYLCFSLLFCLVLILYLYLSFYYFPFSIYFIESIIIFSYFHRYYNIIHMNLLFYFYKSWILFLWTWNISHLKMEYSSRNIDHRLYSIKANVLSSLDKCLLIKFYLNILKWDLSLKDLSLKTQ
jgi:hypothetical protein